MTARQKITHAIDRAIALGQRDDVPLELRALVLTLTVMRGQIESQISSEPSQLDEMLLKGAAWALALRDDDAPELTSLDELQGHAGALEVTQ